MASASSAGSGGFIVGEKKAFGDGGGKFERFA